MGLLAAAEQVPAAEPAAVAVVVAGMQAFDTAEWHNSYLSLSDPHSGGGQEDKQGPD